MGSPVIHFEVQATDRIALAAFYEAVFGWKTLAAEGMPYTLLFPTGGGEPGQQQSIGIGGGMLDRNGPPPEEMASVNAFVCIIQVEDLDRAEGLVKEHGGSIALPSMTVPGVGRVFYGKDPDGNLFGVLQPPPEEPAEAEAKPAMEMAA